MRRILSALIIALFLFLNSFNLVLAQDSGTLLPETSKTIKECNQLFTDFELGLTPKESVRVSFNKKTEQEQRDYLGCGIVTGKIRLWMIPFFIVYFVEFVIGLSGLVAVFFLIIGGFQYILSGATDKQDTAKNTIKFALIGMILVLVAWVLVNLVQFAVTI